MLKPAGSYIPTAAAATEADRNSARSFSVLASRFLSRSLVFKIANSLLLLIPNLSEFVPTAKSEQQKSLERGSRLAVAFAFCMKLR